VAVLVSGMAAGDDEHRGSREPVVCLRPRVGRRRRSRAVDRWWPL